MNKEILSRLDLLAEKLGMSVDYLWPALVQQQLIKGVYYAVAALALLIGSFIYWRHAKVLIKDRENPTDVREFHFISSYIVLAAAATFGTVFLGRTQVLFSPEAAAFSELMRVLGG